VGDAAADKIKKCIENDGPESFAFVLSPQASCEDIHLAVRFAREVVGTERFYMGGKADGGSDDFLIEADKNPNRRGIEAVLGGLDAVKPFAELTADIESGAVKAVYMMGADTPTDTEARAAFFEAIDQLNLFVFASPHASELAAKAHVALPTATHAEKDGTFVNGDGIAQSFYQAFSGNGSALADWQVFMRIAKALGTPLTYTYLNQVQEEMFAASEAPEPDVDAKETEEPASEDDGGSSAPPPAE
jgi:NADH-quinone oxidoreductase subunit G